MFLGLDLGTTNVKVLVVDLDGAIVAQSSAPVERWTTPGGGVEQDIDQIWDATCQAIRQTLAQAPGQTIQAIGVSSQGGAMQWIDARRQPIGRVISWLDARGQPFDRQIEKEWGESYLIEHTGCNLSTTSLGQILRLQQDSPESFNAAREIGFVGDMIVERLCGRRAHDATSLSLAMLYNPAIDNADPVLLARLNLREKRLPDLIRPTEPAGPLQASAARATGLPVGIPVSPAIHDQYAAALGAGAVAAGDVLIGSGTAWVLLAVTARLTPPVAPRTFVCRHPVDGLFGQMFSMGNAGNAVESALKAAGTRDLDAASFDALLASASPGADGLRFQLSRNVAPSKNSRHAEMTQTAVGTFAGSDPFGSPARMLRAVVEGLAFELTWHLERFSQAGVPLQRLVISGPAASGRVLPQIIADVAHRPVTCVGQPAVSAFGAAVIAQALTNTKNDLSGLALSHVPACRAVAPDADAKTYQRVLQNYFESFAAANLQE
ncbi:MAG: FGGY-family carbohydrate kinase [Pirellulales bacterium]|nr:FGGY-family carbohydrate kinase [Pirellulales bacterium]